MKERELPGEEKSSGSKHTCAHCARVFGSLGELSSHIQEEHPERYTVKRLKPLSEQKEGELSCSLCGEECNSLENLALHYRKKHPAIYEYERETKRYTCGHCKRYFLSPLGLRIHNIKKGHTLEEQYDKTKDPEAQERGLKENREHKKKE